MPYVSVWHARQEKLPASYFLPDCRKLPHLVSPFGLQSRLLTEVLGPGLLRCPKGQRLALLVQTVSVESAAEPAAAFVAAASAEDH